MFACWIPDIRRLGIAGGLFIAFLAGEFTVSSKNAWMLSLLVGTPLLSLRVILVRVVRRGVAWGVFNSDIGSSSDAERTVGFGFLISTFAAAMEWK